MEEIQQQLHLVMTEIQEVSDQINTIENLLVKDFNDWSLQEKRLYGIDEEEARKRLRKKKVQLGEEEEHLREEELRLLKKEEQLREEELREEELREQQAILLRNKQMTNAARTKGIKFLF